MSARTTTREINRSLQPKKVDQFYVEFFDLPENISNILGRQIRSIERPTISFSQFERPYKGAMAHDHGKLEFSEISVQLYDDDQSLTTKAIYDQIYRQLGTGAGVTPEQAFNNARFTLRVKCFGADGRVNEMFDLTKCFISGATHTEQIHSDAQGDNIITLTIRYDNVAYDFSE